MALKIWGNAPPKLKSHNSGNSGTNLPRFKRFTEHEAVHKPEHFVAITQALWGVYILKLRKIFSLWDTTLPYINGGEIWRG